ncbi:hypothetical protein [Paraburkholderia sp. BCC1885]|uniref:hypothetical protein n=1 Tax=Paraburkholderia sp. BCC1885 TaxID=2562669 RepID=UPI001182037E|nr:hypothetical protein [Paraburkholderia sp. BCC1885]
MHAATVVELPDGDPIDCRDLIHAIAGAFLPVPTNGARAMACIAGKILHATAVSSGQEPQQADLFGKDSPAPSLLAQSQLDLPEPTVFELHLPQKLMPEEIVWLRSVLDDLPSLRWPVSEVRRIEFLDAYRRVADGRNWEPNVFTPSEVKLRRTRQAPYVDAHWTALQDACDEGLVRIFDTTGIALKRLHPGLGCLISRRHAKSYLEERGFTLSESANGPSLDRDGSHVELLEFGETSAKSESKVGKPRLTPAEKVELVEYYYKLKNSGMPDHTKKTAEKYKVSRHTVTDHVKKAAFAKEKQIDRLLVTRKK